eukprot:7090966-Prymnesium_polylepis.2
MFVRSAAGRWNRLQKLLAPQPAYSAVFGWHVALSGGTLAVGAYGVSFGRGAVYVYSQSPSGGWSLASTVTASDEGAHRAHRRSK